MVANTGIVFSTSVTTQMEAIDRVARSIAECIRLGEDALRYCNDPDRVPFGLRNAATTYSDHI